MRVFHRHADGRIQQRNPGMFEVDLTGWFCGAVQPGDLVLTGCSDVVSRLVQLFTGSDFSHAAIVTGSGTVVEAYDYGLTPQEDDGGAYETPFDVLLKRGALDRIMIRRPVDLDADSLERTVRFALNNAPPFPNVGVMATVLLLVTARPLGQRVLRGLRRIGFDGAFGRALIRVVADGPEHCHCSELVVRLYSGAEVPLVWRDPALGPYMPLVSAAVRRGDGTIRVDRKLRGKVASLNRHLGRKAFGGDRVMVDVEDTPIQVVGAMLVAVLQTQSMLKRAILARVQSAHNHESDIADLIVPADLERVEPFETIGCVVKRRDGWCHVGPPV